MRKNTINKILLLVSISFFIAMPVFASEFSFNKTNKDVSVSQQFQVDLNINTDKENINAVEGKVIFDTNSLELSEIRSGNSIINFWVDKPVYKDGGIVFSGITPGGFVLDRGLVLSFIFNAKKEGNTSVKLENANTLKNDGLGTKTKVNSSDLNLNILKEDKTKKEPTLFLVDKEAPDTFKPEVAEDPNLLDNKWFVVFIAQDKGSGIEKYEVKESKYRIFDFSKWNTAESPYVLADQSLQSYIYVKAIDKQGNERIIRVSPKKPMAWYANIENWFIIVLVISVALTFRFLYVRKNKNK